MQLSRKPRGCHVGVHQKAVDAATCKPFLTRFPILEGPPPLLRLPLKASLKSLLFLVWHFFAC